MVLGIERLKNGIVFSNCQVLFAARRLISTPLVIGLVMASLFAASLSPVLALSLNDSPNLFERGFKRAAPADGYKDRPDDNQPLLVTADELIASQDGNVITARGAVKIVQGNRSLTADEVRYDKIKDTVVAKSFPPNRVAFNFESGDTLYGSEIVTNSDLKNAIIQGFRLLMADNSRAAASSAIHTETAIVNSTEMRKFVFSPCALCADDPTRPPTWQLVAERGRQDSLTHDIVYRNMRLEIKGVPIFWLPYLSHPDWTVKRRSGLLTPHIGGGTNLGTVIKTPYYSVIDDQSDLTLEPALFTGYGTGLGMEYRRRFAAGNFRLAGTLAKFNPSWMTNKAIEYPDIQNNIFASGNLAINEDWRAGFNLDRVSNASYFTQFRPEAIFRNPIYNQASNHLVSDAFVERFDRKNYNLISAYSFQANNPNVANSVVPLVTPYLLDSRYLGLDPSYGSLVMNSSLLTLRRKIGTNTNRFSHQFLHQFQTISDIGLETTVTTSVRNDYYVIGHLKLNNPNSETEANIVEPIKLPEDHYINTTIYRGFPITGLRFSYPLAAAGSSLTMTPTVQFVASPRGLNPESLPNNDSQSFDLNEANLFELNRFAGNDRVSSGSRIDYAYRVRAEFTEGVGLGGFVGQSFRLDKDFIYPVGSGADRQVSDLLSKLSFNYNQTFSLNYSLRLDNQYFKPTRQEISSSLATEPMVLTASYIENNPRVHSDAAYLASEKDGFVTPLSRSMSLTSRFKIIDDWQGLGYWNRDLVHRVDTKYGGGVRYRDDCIGYQITAEQTNYSFGLVRPNTTIMFRIGFKYLGDWDYASSDF